MHQEQLHNLLTAVRVEDVQPLLHPTPGNPFGIEEDNYIQTDDEIDNNPPAATDIEDARTAIPLEGLNIST